MTLRDHVLEAKRRLGIDRLVLAIHDASFPSTPDEDVGQGTPYGEGGKRLLRFAGELGFDGIQLGPQGMTSAYNPSPYDGTIFARNPASLSVTRLIEEGWVKRSLPFEGGDRWHSVPAQAHQAMARVTDQAWRTHREQARPEVLEAVRRFALRHEDWLVPLALYEVLVQVHGHGHFAHWRSDRDVFAAGQEAKQSALRVGAAAHIERLAFIQYLAHRQHEQLRREAAKLGLSLLGDLQVGLAPCDEWSYQRALLPGYRLGAPPSRTNPEGQPWGYAMLHPAQRDEDSPASRLLRARFRKALAEYDAVRIDHPHGIVCPWVYRDDVPDSVKAVQRGARLFSSPDLADHPQLAAYSIPRADQLDRTRPRYDDDWVRSLEPSQVDGYAAWMDLALRCAEEAGGGSERLVCEILSTRPRPLAEVSRREGVGRFRVSQKANLDDPGDVYRPQNAAPEDWVMIGTHDTAPIWAVMQTWGEERRRREAEHLSAALGMDDPKGSGSWCRDDGQLACAKLAELFACPARQVSIFFADLFGLQERYNTPGTIGPHNWRLRLPPDFEHHYESALDAGEALDLPHALALALRARGMDDGLCAALLSARRAPSG